MKDITDSMFLNKAQSLMPLIAFQSDFPQRRVKKSQNMKENG